MEEEQGQGEIAEALLEAQGERDAALGERDAVRRELTAAAARYREALVAGNPEVPGELIGGESIEALDASLEAARRVVEAVKARAVAGRREPQATAAVPAGAPVRTGADVSGMSAAEKIRYGLSNG